MSNNLFNNGSADIRSHYKIFCTFSLGVDEVDYSLYPKREHQLKWIRAYLEEAARLKGTCH